jgi:2-methylcitrate dehydratase PrpD
MDGHSFPQRFEALVEVRLHDDRTLNHRIDNARGAPDRPVLEADVIAKFRANASRAMANGSVEAVLQAILDLDHAATLAPLTAALRSIRA